MSRLTEPVGDNGGKNAWRHLTSNELCTVAGYASANGILATRKHFEISYGTVMRACGIAGVTPAPTPRKCLDLAAIAKAAETKPRAEVAAQFGIAESTVTRAKQKHGKALA